MPRLFSWEEEERQTAAEHQRERGADNRPRPRDQLADKTGMEENEEPGLVIYPITARSEIEEQLQNLGMEMGNRQRKNSEQSGHFIVLTPGSIRIKRRGITQSKKPETAKERQAIKAWSKKSQANMVSRFSSLDLSPLEVASILSPRVVNPIPPMVGFSSFFGINPPDSALGRDYAINYAK